MKDYFFNLPEKCELTSNEHERVEVLPNLNTSYDVTMDVLDITKEAIRCFADYSKCKEHEKTERKRIVATLRAIEYQIDAQKVMYIEELNKLFEERNKLYSLAEKVQEKALLDGDKEMLQLCLNFILNVYNKPVNLKGVSSTLFTNKLESFEERKY